MCAGMPRLRPASRGVFARDELVTRAELYYENYYITVTVEARTLLQMLTTLLIPAARKGGAQATEVGQQLEAAAAKVEQAMAAIERAECGSLEQARYGRNVAET